jgi:hypothetical protein
MPAIRRKYRPRVKFQDQQNITASVRVTHTRKAPGERPGYTARRKMAAPMRDCLYAQAACAPSC